MENGCWPPPKDIAEVRNAFEIYERLETLDPYSIDDLLAVHTPTGQVEATNGGP